MIKYVLYKKNYYHFVYINNSIYHFRIFFIFINFYFFEINIYDS